MANPFDQFDSQPTPAPAGASANPFDQFDQPGIGARIGKDLADRVQVGKDIIGAPDRSIPAKALQYVGKVGAGLANDVVGEGVKSAVGAIPQPVKDVVSTGVDDLEKAASVLPGMNSYSNAVQNSLKGSQQLWEKTKQNYPSFAATLESVGNVAQLAGTVGAVDAAAGAVRSGVNGVSDAMANKPPAPPKAPPVPNLSSQDLRDISSGIYQKAAQAGGSLNADFTDKFVDDITQAATSHIQTPADAAQAAAWKLQNPAADLISGAQEAKGQPMSLQIAQTLDQKLGDLVHDNVLPDGHVNSAGREYSILQGKLRDAIKNAPPEQFIGGQAGFDASIDARKSWMYQAQLNDVERIIAKAQGQTQPAAAMQRGFYSLYTNPARSAGFEPDDFALIKKAGSKNIGADILNSAGSGLVPYVAASIGSGAGALLGPGTSVAGGFAGLAAGKAISMASKVGAEALQAAPAAALKQSIISKALAIAAKYK